MATHGGVTGDKMRWADFAEDDEDFVPRVPPPQLRPQPTARRWADFAEEGSDSSEEDVGNSRACTARRGPEGRPQKQRWAELESESEDEGEAQARSDALLMLRIGWLPCIAELNEVCDDEPNEGQDTPGSEADPSSFFLEAEIGSQGTCAHSEGAASTDVPGDEDEEDDLGWQAVVSHWKSGDVAPGLEAKRAIGLRAGTPKAAAA
mmetsp:Transcript_121841/g.389626  ORF Transcript_121841/g.389626 Transcript_121841/m.389626 type:complete len:206 (+) Transcript_121841:82-699(+)